APGTFGSAARTSVVWLGLGGDVDALRALAGRVETAVEAAGLPPERRELRPHVTLARVRQRASTAQRRALAAAVGALDAPGPHPYRAVEVVLVRSHLGAGQPRYEVLGRY
ncbi:MAG: RNA 2',3'-cyclic phosphodiesterase, partial [Chloroflexi bacterium]|nr:RNA 2',3'-cyclic phosphodiesterase [Chloroflexota bacterium]